MDYLGEKDGANVYRDRNTGIFYVDDGVCSRVAFF